MLKHMSDIGNAIRKDFWWVSNDIPIYLFMDSQGGHGTNDTKAEYERMLKEEHNVIILW